MTERLTVDEFGALHKARYGDRPAARAAVALYRKSGWTHIDSSDWHADTEEIQTRVFSFCAGYEARDAEVEQLRADLQQAQEDRDPGMSDCRPPSPFCTCCECQGIHCMLPHPGHSHRYTLPDESSPIMSYVQREPTITRAELEARLTPDVLAEIVEADNREVWDWDLVRQAILDAAFPPSEGARE